MSAKYISVDEAVKRAGGEKFFQNVRNEIIPRLIEKGLLQGKDERERQLVADDDALAQVMGLGVEKFVYNQQGYSFVVVRAPIERVAEVLKARPGAVKYAASVEPQEMIDDAMVDADENVRHCFVLQMRDAPEWTVLVQTVHWFHSCDAVMATALASVLSDKLKTLAAAGWDDDFSGSSLLICEDGEHRTIGDEGEEEDSWADFYEFFYEQGIQLPSLFIGVEDGSASLYVDDPAQVKCADYLLLKVPKPIESEGPHVFEKVGMMAEAMLEGLEDEEAFMAHMRGGVSQAEAILAAGEI